MDLYTDLAGGAPLSPEGEGVLLLLWGAFAGLIGWGLVLKKTGLAEAMVRHGNQMQSDFQQAYGRLREVKPGDAEGRRFITRTVGWAFALMGPVCFVAGVTRLIALTA